MCKPRSCSAARPKPLRLQRPCRRRSPPRQRWHCPSSSCRHGSNHLGSSRHRSRCRRRHRRAYWCDRSPAAAVSTHSGWTYPGAGPGWWSRSTGERIVAMRRCPTRSAAFASGYRIGPAARSAPRTAFQSDPPSGSAARPARKIEPGSGSPRRSAFRPVPKRLVHRSRRSCPRTQSRRGRIRRRLRRSSLCCATLTAPLGGRGVGKCSPHEQGRGGIYRQQR